MEGIQITLAEVSNTAQTIRRLNTQMAEELKQMQQEMNQLASTWQSPAAETIRGKFNGMRVIFDNYGEIVGSYAKFLDNTVLSYESCEQNIQQYAASFQ